MKCIFISRDGGLRWEEVALRDLARVIVKSRITPMPPLPLDASTLAADAVVTAHKHVYTRVSSGIVPVYQEEESN